MACWLQNADNIGNLFRLWIKRQSVFLYYSGLFTSHIKVIYGSFVFIFWIVTINVAIKPLEFHEWEWLLHTKPKHQIGTFNNWTIANYPILSFHEEQPTIELIYGTVGYSHTYLQDYCEPTKKPSTTHLSKD